MNQCFYLSLLSFLKNTYTHACMQACDTVDNIDREVIEQMGQAAASVLDVSTNPPPTNHAVRQLARIIYTCT